MKKYFLALILAAAAILLHAETRLAVIGEPAIVEMILPELSEVTLLERSEIDKVLKEHKLTESELGSGELQRYFPHADIFAVAKSGQLRVFNAKSGFLLEDFAYRDAEEAARGIRRALVKQTLADPVLVSIVAVRNVGVLGKQQTTINEFMSMLERKLVAMEKVQLLERNRLESVLAERDLSSTQYRLAAAARLIALEFEPGSDYATVHMRFVITEPGGKELFRGEVKDVFRNQSESVSETVLKITEFLKLPKSTATGGSEAERFYREYLALEKSGHRQEAARKLYAAVALAPMNEKYRYEEVRWRPRLTIYSPWSERIPLARKQLESCKRFNRDFPNRKKECFAVYMVLGDAPSNQFGRLSVTEMEELSDISDELRELNRAEIRRIWYPFDLTDGINSIKELSNYSDWVIRTNRPDNYCNYRKWLGERYGMMLEFLRHVEGFLKKNPDKAVAVDKLINQQGMPEVLNVFYPNYPGDLEEFIIGYLNNVDEYIEYVGQYPLPTPRKTALVLKLMRDAVKGERTKEYFCSLLDRYFADLDLLDPNALKTPDKPGNWSTGGAGAHRYRISEFSRWWLRDNGYSVSERLKAYQMAHDKISDWAKVEELLNKRDVKGLLPYVPVLQKYNYDRICKNKIANLYSGVAHDIWVRHKNKKSAPEDDLALFQALNSDFEISARNYGEVFKSSKPLLLEAAVKSDSGLHLLLREDYHGNLFIGSLSMKEEPGKLVETQFRNFSGRTNIIARNRAPFAVSDDYVVFAGDNRNLVVYSRKNNSLRIFEDAFPDFVRSVVIHKGRVYLLCGGRSGGERNNSLLSLLPDNSDRKIHFSNARNIPQNELDKDRGYKVDSLLVLNDDELGFTVTLGNQVRIYRYRITEERFDILCKFPFNGHNTDMLWLQEGMLYLHTMGHGERIYRIDPANGKAEWIFAQSRARYKFDPPEDKPVMIEGGWQLQDPWLLKGHYLWSGYYTPAVVDLRDPKKSPLLMLPGCPYLFDWKEQQVIYLGKENYFIVQPK